MINPVPGTSAAYKAAKVVEKGEEVLKTAEKAKDAARISEKANDARKLEKGAEPKIIKESESGAAPKAERIKKPPEEKRVEQEQKQGGAHRDTTKPANDGFDSHHMPAKDTYKDKTYPETDHKVLHPDDGPAVKVKPETHKETSSHGPSAEAANYRSEISDKLDEGKWRDAMATEIKDLRRASKEVEGNSTNYNKGIKEMLDYAKDKGLLNKKTLGKV